jgi:hypothetical protein
MFETKVVEEIKTHILDSATFYFNHAVNEIMCKNIVGPGRPQMKTWHVRIACRIPESANTH